MQNNRQNWYHPPLNSPPPLPPAFKRAFSLSIAPEYYSDIGSDDNKLRRLQSTPIVLIDPIVLMCPYCLPPAFTRAFSISIMRDAIPRLLRPLRLNTIRTRLCRLSSSYCRRLVNAAQKASSFSSDSIWHLRNYLITWARDNDFFFFFFYRRIVFAAPNIRLTLTM